MMYLTADFCGRTRTFVLGKFYILIFCCCIMKRKEFWVGAVSGGVGAGFGSASGSNSLLVVVCVGVVISLLVAWGIRGFVK